MIKILALLSIFLKTNALFRNPRHGLINNSLLDTIFGFDYSERESSLSES